MSRLGAPGSLTPIFISFNAVLLVGCLASPAIGQPAEPPADPGVLSLEALDQLLDEDADNADDAGDPQQGGSGPISLDDLDALFDDDGEEASAPLEWSEIADIGGLVVILSIALFSFFTKSQRLKYVTLVLSVAYLGFYKANLVSIVNIFTLVGGNLPDFRISMPWYLMMVFTVVSTVLWGRLYCGRICAFGALTQLMDATIPSRFRVELPPSVDRWAIYTKYVLLGGVLLYFLASGNFLVYRYLEPFWMFTLSGTTVMWVMLGVLLVATVFVRNLYCRYLCSVGAALGLISNLTVFRIKRWSECKTCKICEKACEWGAIDGPKIIASECVRCDDCERLYHDEKRCVHWIVLRRSAPRQTGASA